MKSLSLYLYIFLIIFCLPACKTKKKIPVSTEIISLDSIFNQIFDAYQPEWIVGKAKIKITSSQGTDRATMFLRSRKDSVIWTVFKRLSIEGARAQITNDSVYIVNRLQKNYQVLDINNLNAMYGMVPDLNSIQELIAAQIPEIDTTQFWEYAEDETHFNFRSAKDNLLIDFSFDKYSGYQTHGKFIDGYSFTAYWQYDDYKAVNGLMIPFYRKYSIEFSDQNYLNIILEFSDLEIDKTTNIRFNIPSHYDRLN